MNNMKTFKFLTTLFATAILTACTLDMDRPTNVQYIDKTDAIWQQHLQKIQKIQSYQAKGQIGYISPTERFLAALNGNTKIQNLIRLNSIL